MGFGPNETRNVAYLRAVLGAFADQAISYCASGTNEQARFENIKSIRNALVAIGQQFPSMNFGNNCPSCPPGQHCEGGVCVPDNATSGWPTGDPPAWNG
ncbi:MAG: hypothetical protein U0Z53_10525 [Blastocatellia bacterium]